MVGVSPGPLLLAFVITVVEMTEVVALVFALRGESESIRPGATGAVAGVFTVALLALLTGAALERLPTAYLLLAAGLTLFAFGLFLFRSTRRAYRRAWHPAPGPKAAPGSERAVQFGGGFTIGAVEAIETVVVLISLAAAGAGTSALVGALVAGGVLVVAALLVHERIRRIKVPTLKLGATALLFSFSLLWTGEAFGIRWPLGDLLLIPFFLVALGLLRPLLGWLEDGPAYGLPSGPKG